MPPNDQYEREIRAARNQSMFRSVNEKLLELNEALGAVSESFVIACECADTRCVATLEVSPREYLEVRGQPNTFIVLAGHVYPDVEHIVGQDTTYVVVEKTGAAGEFAASLEPSGS